jgi:hypothetical protein
MQLAAMDQQKGDTSSAHEHLIAASMVEPCCHTGRGDIEALVAALVRMERPDAAVAYLRQFVEAGQEWTDDSREILGRYGVEFSS